jgi:hypothetical protein
MPSPMEALLARAADEAARRNRPATFRLDSLLFAQELAAANDTAREQAWACGRRSGKTTTAEAKLTETCLANPGTQSFYVSTSIKRAVATVWDEVLLLNHDHELGGVPNQSTHVITYPNASKLWVTGVEDRVMANDLRGRKKVKLYIIDECQDWKDELLRYFYQHVVYPSFSDVRGSVIFAGTGGNPRGFWYERTVDPTVAQHTWTPFDNKHLADGEAQALIEKAMRERGCDITDPSIQREFFAKFVADLNRQIFHYDDARNGYDPADLPPDDGAWRFSIGMDVGTVDYTAVHVWGWHPSSPRLWKRASVKRKDLGSSGQAALIKAAVAEWRQRGTVVGVVGDPGGGGKPLIVDMKGAWPGAGTGSMEVAEKLGKPAACIMMRDDLRSGRIAIDRADKDFIADLAVPEWDPSVVEKVIKNHFPDTIDAALYGYREARHHWYREPPPEPEDREAAERKARIADRVKRAADARNPLSRRDPRRLLR